MNTLYTSPILQGSEVSVLIPQKPPIEMVDTLWYNDDTKTVSGFRIPSDNMFCEEGYLKEPGLIENIAQTAALRVGYMSSLMSKDENTHSEPPIGYIGAIKNLVIHHLPQAGLEIMTEVVIQNMVFDVTIIQGTVMLDGKTIAQCEMKIFLKQD